MLPPAFVCQDWSPGAEQCPLLPQCPGIGPQGLGTILSHRLGPQGPNTTPSYHSMLGLGPRGLVPPAFDLHVLGLGPGDWHHPDLALYTGIWYLIQHTGPRAPHRSRNLGDHCHCFPISKILDPHHRLYLACGQGFEHP